MLDPAALTLVAVTDDIRGGAADLISRSAAAVRGGATMVQLRLKDADARTVVEVARAMIATLPIPVIVNDRADIALAAGAAGVHLGQGDLSPATVRHLVSVAAHRPDTWFIIGASMGSEAEIENAAGADYVGIGPVRETGSKHDAGHALGVERFGVLARLTHLPAVAIGGITAMDVPALRAAGASGVAVIRSLLGSADPERAAREFLAASGR
ncbi:MAG: thiamine phosphate synthase [Gemmatimonadaceae bacterium]